jgi:CBS domain-containing protein
MAVKIGQPEVKAVSDFVRHCQPFDELTQEQLSWLIGRLSIAYYRRGDSFDEHSDEPGLSLLRSGALEIRDQFNTLLDRLEEGSSFHVAELCEDNPSARAVLIEDALIYRLEQADYLSLCERCRSFDRFYHSQRDRRMRRAARYEPVPHQMLSLVSSVMSKDLLALTRQHSLAESASLMTAKRVSSGLIIEDEQLLGIVTDRDFRSRVISQGLASTTAISEVMTPNPDTIDCNATLFDATLLMTQRGIHHLPVLDQGMVVGIITSSDLILAKQDDPVYVVQHLSRQQSVEGLKAITAVVPNMLVAWVESSMRASQISRILTAISDVVTSRLIELAIQQLGPAPVAFCWLDFGSQARGEQLLGADQDNGLLIADTLQDSDRAWFEQLATFVCDGLNECGYVYCPGKVMATTDEWRQPLSVWRETVDRWTRSPTPAAVMRVSIFFDLRVIYGDTDLAQQLQQTMLEKTSTNSIFLAALAANVLQHIPPLGLFRRFLVERNGEHRDSLNLKKRGVLPIIDMLRIHCLAHKISAVNSHERIAELVRREKMSISDGRNLQDAFDFIMQLRVGEQARQLVNAERVSNYFNPNNLPSTGRRHLRDAFTVVTEAQEALRLQYRSGL